MAEELVIWIDEAENVLGPIPISLANSDPKYLHLEVAVLVVDKNQRVLLQQRAYTKRVHPGRWTTTAAGHVTHGETVVQAAHKELFEETGLKVKMLHPLFSEKVTLPNETHITHWFIGRYEEGVVVPQTCEVANVAWVGEVELDDFLANKDVGQNSLSVVERYWQGEWDHLLK
jgi:isopentenyldiphosphate isomerase